MVADRSFLLRFLKVVVFAVVPPLLAIGALFAATEMRSPETGALVLIVALFLLIAVAGLLQRYVAAGTKASGFLVACSAVVAGGWVWQRIAFVRILPRDFLEYGYFLTPAGPEARFWVLELPWASTVAILTVLFLVAAVSVWRSGLRLGILSLVGWWVACALLFSLPSLYLHLQGDAAIFI